LQNAPFGGSALTVPATKAPREGRGGGLPERGEGVGRDGRRLRRHGDGPQRDGSSRAGHGGPRAAFQGSAPPMRGALAGLPVVDCSRLIAGGVLATILADHGAAVVKAENPRGGAP